MFNIYNVGNGAMSLNEAYQACKDGDLILFNPGTYSFGEFKISKNITLSSRDLDPDSVKIIGSIVFDGETLKLSNLTLINQREKSNSLVTLKGQTFVYKVKLIDQRRDSHNYPAVFNRACLCLNNFTLECEEEENLGIDSNSNSSLELINSQVNTLSLDGSQARLINTRIELFLKLINSRIDSFGYLAMLAKLEDIYTIYMENSYFHLENLVHNSINKIFLSRSDLELLYIDNRETRIDIWKEANDIAIFPSMANIQLFVKNEEPDFFVDRQVQASNIEAEASSQEANFNQEIKENLGLEDPADTYEESHLSSDIEDPMEDLDNLIGLESVKAKTRDFINIVKFHKLREKQGLFSEPVTLHSVFYGNPGTGKTSVARILARILRSEGVIKNDRFVEVSRKDLVSEYIGKTAIQTQEKLEEARGGILFIDEAYSLNSKGENDFGQEAVDTILKFMEDYRDDVMIIFAGYTDKMQGFLNMNPGLKSRVPNAFNFEDYSPEELATIGLSNLKKEGFILDENYYTRLVQQGYSMDTDKSNARWVRNFNDKLKMIVANRVISTNSNDFQNILREDLYKLSGSNLEEKEAHFQEYMDELDQMIGLDSVKSFVKSLVSQVRADKKLEELSPSHSKQAYHMVFAGNPGTGKTVVARIISKLFYTLDILPNQTLIEVDRSDMVGRYIGETEAKTGKILEEAMGGVLFIDEAYQLKQGGENDFGKQAIEALISGLENYRHNFVCIFAGYSREMEDFLRTNPGLKSRIPIYIEFPDYSPEEVAEICEKILESQKWGFNRKLLKELIVDKYSSLSGEDRSNGRYARNLAEKIVREHKIYIANNDIEVDLLTWINDSSLRRAIEL